MVRGCRGLVHDPGVTHRSLTFAVRWNTGGLVSLVAVSPSGVWSRTSSRFSLAAMPTAICPARPPNRTTPCVG
jgi:hypothetical protein